MKQMTLRQMKQSQKQLNQRSAPLRQQIDQITESLKGIKAAREDMQKVSSDLYRQQVEAIRSRY